MSIDDIRELNDAVPFQPYEIHRADGRIAAVAHPDFVAFSPTGRFVVVVSPDNHVQTISVSHIVDLHHAAADETAEH